MSLEKLNAKLNNHGNLIQWNDTNSKLQKSMKTGEMLLLIGLVFQRYIKCYC